MNARDFRIGWRLLIKDPGYSAAVVGGLTLGFAVCFLMLSFAYASFRFDAQVPDNDRIYLLKVRKNTHDNPYWMEYNALPLRDVAAHSGLDLTTAAVAFPMDRNVQVGETVRKYMLRVVDPGFPEIFGIKPLEGDLGRALTRPDAMAVTATTAGQLFGDSHAVGKTVRIDDKVYAVAAILPDPPATTTQPYSILVGPNSATISNDDRKDSADWTSFHAKIYFKLGTGVSPQKLVQVLQDALDRSPLRSHFPPEKLQQLGNRKIEDVGLVALPSVHFDPDFAYAMNEEIDDRRYGDARAVVGLAAVALLILLLAATNYVNLATVRTMRRRREIAVRKLMGASASRIANQFLAESMLVAIVATVLGIGLGWALSPLFSELIIHQRLHPSSFSDIGAQRVIGAFTPLTVGFSLLFGTVVGLVAGVYPAWIALRVRTVDALAGRGSEETAGSHGQSLRRLLTILQFATAMGLTSVTLAIAGQTDFATHFNPGFDPTPLMSMGLPWGDPNLKPQIQAFRNALTRLPQVENVAGEDTVVGNADKSGRGDVQRLGGGILQVHIDGVTPQFFQTYRVNAIAGRVFDPSLDREDNSTGAVINATAAHAIGFASPQAAVGHILTLKREGESDRAVRILGVSSDIVLGSLRVPPQPVINVIDALSADEMALTVRARGDVDAAQHAIETVWPHYFRKTLLRYTGPSHELNGTIPTTCDWQSC